MGRRKIEIKAIKDDRNRSVTFLKRKGGLFKKAHELSVLCSVDVAVIIFGHNKKLYEFSSGDIRDTIGRYQYYGSAHEHKGPDDFNGKRAGGDDDDDDDEAPGSPGPAHQSMSPPERAMIPPNLHNQPQYQHIRHATPSASPPISNGMMFHPQRHPSPQPVGNNSRPESRAHVRRTSSNLAPPPGLMPGSQPAPPPPSYAYMPNPPIYNPQAAAGMPIRSQPAPQPPQPHPHAPQFHYSHPLPNPQIHQAYQEEQRRQSMPPSFPSQVPEQPPTTVHAPSPPLPLAPPPTQHGNFSSPPLPQPKPLSVKAQSHSIFTPIDDSRSLLAQWGPSSHEQSRNDPHAKMEGLGAHSQMTDAASMSRELPNGRTMPNDFVRHAPPPPQRTTSTSAAPTLQPPSRTNIMPTTKPKLKVQIPDEHSESEAGTGSSPRGDVLATVTPSRGPGEAGVIVLPPPSPSASALLSAGVSGPPNPFARPAPPVNNSYGNRSENMDTPMSALPSRFVSDQLLPSPSSFYPDWGFVRDTNMLPSPLTFPTPIVTNGPSLRDDDNERKRKTSEGSDTGLGKRIKTSP